MSSTEKDLPATQSALQWVRVSDTNPFEWTTSAPVINPSELGDNQVLIENHAISLNPIDYKMAEKNFAKVKLPAVTGYDVSGRIVAIGKNVQDFQINDEVFGFLNFNSSHGGGALQQYSVGEADALIKKPTDINHTDAATLGVAFLSAMDGLRQVDIHSSTSIFLPGGSGGVGHFIVQIAQIRGAKQIITTASKDEGIQILKQQYKIKDIINHAKENVIDRVFELTQGQGVDIAYDSTYSESSIEKSIKVVKQGGSCIVLRSSMQDNSEIAKKVAEHQAIFVFADTGRYWMGTERTQLKTFVQKSLAQGVKWIEEGRLKPYINQIIQLDQAQNALEQLKQGKSGFGKIVIKLF